MEILRDIFRKIVYNKQIDDLKSDEDIYNLCLAHGYTGTYTDFESESSGLLDLLLQENKLDDEYMENVSGGSKDLLKKGAALSLAFMPFASPSIDAMQNINYSVKSNSKATYVASKIKEIAKKHGIPIGILTSAGVAGLCLLYIYSSNNNKKGTNLKHSNQSVNSNTNRMHINDTKSGTSSKYDTEYAESNTNSKNDFEVVESNTNSAYDDVLFDLKDEDDAIQESLNPELEQSKSDTNLLAKAIWDVKRDSSIIDKVSQKFNIQKNADAGLFNPSCGLVVIRDCADSVSCNSLEELARILPTTKFLIHTSRKSTSSFGGTWIFVRLCSILPYILAEQYSDEIDINNFKAYASTFPNGMMNVVENVPGMVEHINSLISSNQEDKMLQIKTLKLFSYICGCSKLSSHEFNKCLSLMIRVALGNISANYALINYRDYLRESLEKTSSTRNVSIDSRACQILKRMCTPGDGEAVVNARVAYDQAQNMSGSGAYGQKNRRIFFDNVVEQFGGFSNDRELAYFAFKITPEDIQVKNSRHVLEDKYKEKEYFLLQRSLERFMESEYLLNCNQQGRPPYIKSQISNEVKNLKNLPALIEYIRNFRRNNDYELYLLLSSLTSNSKSKRILNSDAVDESDEIEAHIVGSFGLEWQQSLYLLDEIFAPSIEEFWFGNKSDEVIVNNIINKLIKFSKYVQSPSSLTIESFNFKRIKKALQTENLDGFQQKSRTELLGILGIDDFNDDNHLLKAIHSVKLIDWEKLMCCAFNILTPPENKELQKFASEDYFNRTTIASDNLAHGFGKRNWISNAETEDGRGNHHAYYFDTRLSANVSTELFRELINSELKVYDTNSNVPSDEFYNIQNPINSFDNLISADDVEQVFVLGCKGMDATGRPEEAYSMLEKWFPNERNTKGTTVADFLISRKFYDKKAGGGDQFNFSDSIVFKAIALLEKLMREVGLESYTHILELQSKNTLTDKQKIMVDLRERLGIYFSMTENVCETEQNDLMSQWIFALGCAKSEIDGLDNSNTLNFKDAFISNLSYEMRKEALEKMVSNDRAAVSPIFGPEVRVQLMENFSDCFNVEKPIYQSNYAGDAKNTDCGNAEWVVKSMTNRARAENSSKYLTMGSVALKAIEMLNRNDTRFNQASNIIRNEVKNVKYKFDDLVKILDDKSLLKVSKDVKLYDDNLTYRERFTKLLDYINENENSFDDDEQVDILALKQWIEGNGNDLSINELSSILFDNTSLYLDNEEIMKPLGALDGYGSGFACIMLPLYLVNNGFYTQG